MEKYFALIKNELVESVIVADDDFLNIIQNDYDSIVDVTERNRPASGDSYYLGTDEFISNNITIVELPVDLSADYFQQGTDDGFEPFQLSKYSVKYEDGMLHIGCKQYSGPGFLKALHKALFEDEQIIDCFTTTDGNPRHGKFDITWEDAQLLYDALIKVKFQ